MNTRHTCYACGLPVIWHGKFGCWVHTDPGGQHAPWGHGGHHAHPRELRFPLHNRKD